MNRRLLSLFVIFAAVSLAPRARSAPLLVPMPAKVVEQSGAFEVSARTPIVYFDRRDAFAARYLFDLVKRTRGIALRQGRGAKAIVLKRDTGIGGDEAYRLQVAPEGVTISARTGSGIFYGVVTLWQLLTQTAGEADHIVLNAVTIDDAPRFVWRGMLLDSVRHFQTESFVKQFIDAMAREKLNVLQWHLTDDQGWRIEIKRYPRLTRVGAWRVPAGEAARRDIDASTGKPRLYGGFYSQADIRDIVAYAAERHVTIVPEIEMPGHALAAIVSYPWLASVSNPPSEVSSDWGVYPYLYNPRARTFQFLENVLTEVMALFPSRYIHVGGDEAVKDQWKANPEIQARMHALGLADENALQGWFIARIGKFLAAHGRRLIGWDEILEGGVPPDATITSWRGIDGAITAAKTGHDAVLSPAPILYFDNRQVEGAAEPSGRGAIVSLKDVYDFDPAPPALSDLERKHIIGIQANVWTEHIREQKNVFYAAFPREASLAEVAWSPAATRDWSGFLARVPAELARLDALGTGHSNHLDGPPPAPASPDRRDSHELGLCSNGVVLSIEGGAPVVGPRPVFLHDIMNPCWIWSKAPIGGATGISITAGLLPFNFQIGDDRAKVTNRPPATPNGEFEVRLDGCDGPKIATLPMPHRGADEGLATIHGPVVPTAGTHDLCLMFTTPSVDPYWALHSVELVRK